MDRCRLYISTIAQDAPDMARRYGLGLEIAEFCTAYNMDERFEENDRIVREKLAGTGLRTLHAPFSELFPCAVDPKARALARERYIRAIELARLYGADRVVIHGGYNSQLYFPIWYVEQSVVFWKEFLAEMEGDMLICLENVQEDGPDMLMDILDGVNDRRLKMCLDVGHAQVYSRQTPMKWLEACAGRVGHMHIHNNAGDYDSHASPGCGVIPMEELLLRTQRLCPKATCALEVLEAGPAIRWMEEKRLI